MSELQKKIFNAFQNPVILYICVSILLVLNFLLRLLVFKRTTLFSFSDYSAYIDAISKLKEGEKIYLLNGNFLYAISYLGFFSEKISGNLNMFFIFNCLTGAATGLIIFILLRKITGSPVPGVITLLLLAFYTEHIVFSSVFYTPVLMIFLVSLILLLLWYYITAAAVYQMILSGLLAVVIFLLTFFFKPELKYLPWFLIAGSVLIYLKGVPGSAKRIFFLAVLMAGFYFLFETAGVITRPRDNVISNSFFFFGHTDYGGGGGEGSFLFRENEERYDSAFSVWCSVHGIKNPGLKDYNEFQINEVKNFITHHPFKWLNLQFRKFFRTYGIFPESTSFKVLVTGLLSNNLLAAAAIVTPVVVYILMFILFFPSGLADNLTKNFSSHLSVYLFIYILFFFYYMIATVFYGQYQERYRMPVMVMFIIPAIGYFMSRFDREKDFAGKSVVLKAFIILLFVLNWVVQAAEIFKRLDYYESIIRSI